ncbi:hypothetical protein [Aestuariivivens sediminis]|uniref:hypothetical protein n=1 Tax=Aestuariivivens sediminis TaxID=2913557 RepID=UPI001F58FE8E|nr:hypothetical protein [Aestuariivivens sediminis]
MTTLEEISKNTYVITFDKVASYNWYKITQTLLTSIDIHADLNKSSLINQDESTEKLMYWQDLFFMEIAEKIAQLKINETVLKKIIVHPLYIENKKFIEHLPKAATAFGREVIIDDLIANENRDALIPDDLLDSVLKKKSRDELRTEFTEWNNENKNPSFFKANFKFLIAACLLGVLVTVGYFSFQKNKLDFDNNSFVNSKEISVFQNIGLGFGNNDSVSKITVQVLDYNSLLKSIKSSEDNIQLNTYSFGKQKLRLILPSNNIVVNLILFEPGEYYLNIKEDFFKIDENTTKFVELQKLENTEMIEQLEQIIFENE